MVKTYTDLDQRYSSGFQSSNVQLDQHSAGDRALRNERQLTPSQQSLEPRLTVIPKFQQLIQKWQASQVPPHGSTSTDVQVSNSHASSPTVRSAKDQAKSIRKLEPHSKSQGHKPEPESEPELEHNGGPDTDSDSEPVSIWRRTPRSESQRHTRTLPQTPQNLDKLDVDNESPEDDSDSEPIVARQKTSRSKAQLISRSSERKSRMLRELEGHNKSPEREKDSKHKERRHKKPLSKPKSSSRSSARRSQLLREIEDYNKSPEAEDRHDIALARDLVDKPRLTREARRSLICDAKNESPAPRQNLNLKGLMSAQFKRAGQGTKRFQSEDNSNLSRHKKQRKDTTGLFLGEEEDNGEDTLPNFSKIHDRGHSPSTPTRRLSPKQVGKVAGSSQGNDESSAESAWLPWDTRKGQSTQA